MARPKGSLNKDHKLYTIYNNRTDELVILDGDARQCAAALGMSLESFRSTMSRVRSGVTRKWTILTEEDFADDW